MTKTWMQRSDEFLKVRGQFNLGALVTEASHPKTANLSDAARRDIAAGLKQLFEVDADVIRKYREFAGSGRAEKIADAVAQALRSGGRIFFTGCGSTGRLSILLDSIWRDFWRQQRTDPHATEEIQNAESGKPSGLSPAADGDDWENRTVSVMAGGDFALIKAVEGFEDIAAFGKKQMADLAISAKDVVFAITEGGETSFVIGTAWAAVEAGAKVYFVYNNPDEVLCAHVERSCEVVKDSRIEKINLTTGPMAIAGSTRMQATTIQLCVLVTVLEMAVRELLGASTVGRRSAAGKMPAPPVYFLAQLEAAHARLMAPECLASLARVVALEEAAYRAGNKCSYFAGRFGIDVLSDTTERSPTFCTPPFRKFDDDRAAESLAFLFVPEDWTDKAWEELLKRKPRCVEWREHDIRSLVPEEKLEATLETLEKISSTELMRYKIGSNGTRYRPVVVGDCAVAVASDTETPAAKNFQVKQLELARSQNAHTGLIYFGAQEPADEAPVAEVLVFVRVPATELLLDGVTRVVVKLVMNALSTCTMVRLGRVSGNYMVHVVPSNLKLIDRATRYISQLARVTYEAANRLLFEAIAYVEPRMNLDQAYPPVVRLAVVRAKEKLTNEQAEERLQAEG